MAVLRALRQTPGALRRNPVVFVPMLVLMLLQVPQVILQTIDPLAASAVSVALSLAFVFVLPFFQAGVIGMADEALTGRTSLARFVTDGRSNYVSVLAAYLVLVGANVVLGVVVALVAVVAGLALYTDAGGASTAVLAVVGVVGVALLLAYVVFLFFVQFYGQAIVVEGVGAIDGLRRSVSVVRHHLASTGGYSVTAVVLGGLVGAVSAVASILASVRSSGVTALPHASPTVAVGLAVAVVVVGTLVGGFFGVYSVAFYHEIAPAEAAERRARPQ